MNLLFCIGEPICGTLTSIVSYLYFSSSNGKVTINVSFFKLKIYDQMVKVLRYGCTGNQVLLCWLLVCRGEERCLQRTWVSDPLLSTHSVPLLQVITTCSLMSTAL